MSKVTGLLVLFVAALLEAGGDALMRAGIHRGLLWQRAGLFVVAAVVLFAYGWTVNAPAWDFGKLIGIYVVFFFLIAQVISWVAFQQRPSGTMMAGGALIVAGGLVIALAKT
jgi:hypothetical protein